MHVLVVANHWGIKDNQTFAGLFVDRQIKALRAQGIQVTPFDLGVDYAPKTLWQKIKQMRQLFHEQEIDLVHARYGTIIAMTCVLSGLPTVITYGGSDLLPGASVSKLRTYFGISLSNLAAVGAKARYRSRYSRAPGRQAC